MEYFLGRTTCGGLNVERAQLVVTAWSNCYGPEWLLPAHRGSSPRLFFWRCALKNPSLVRGLMYASRRFVRFLCLGWQEEIRRQQQLEGLPHQLEAAFVPEHFFNEWGGDEGQTVEAYKEHLKGLS